MAEKIYRILIVDDDEDILKNLSDILGDIGYQTDTARCAEDAICKIKQFCTCQAQCQYDLCLLDFKMPGIDGVELYERILKLNPNLRAIMITAYAGDDGIQRAIEAGAWKVIRKPVNIDRLLGSIKEAVS